MRRRVARGERLAAAAQERRAAAAARTVYGGLSTERGREASLLGSGLGNGIGFGLGAAPSAEAVLALQGSVGNRAVSRWLAERPLPNSPPVRGGGESTESPRRSPTTPFRSALAALRSPASSVIHRCGDTACD